MQKKREEQQAKDFEGTPNSTQTPSAMQTE